MCKIVTMDDQDVHLIVLIYYGHHQNRWMYQCGNVFLSMFPDSVKNINVVWVRVWKLVSVGNYEGLEVLSYLQSSKVACPQCHRCKQNAETSG